MNTYVASNSFGQASQKRQRSTVLSKGLKIVTKHNTDKRCTPKKKNQTEVLLRLSDFTFTCPISQISHPKLSHKRMFEFIHRSTKNLPEKTTPLNLLGILGNLTTLERQSV